MTTSHTTSRNSKNTSARAGIIFIRNNQILVIKRQRNGECFYCIPGGHIEVAETAAQAAIRELNEETGLTEIILQPTPIFTFKNQGREETYFVAQSWSGEPILGGEELKRMCAENSYELMWCDKTTIEKEIFHPKRLWGLITEYNLLQ
jgi:8-oxo-dGTP pyrophosphatase MutT (NUDIX family)